MNTKTTEQAREAATKIANTPVGGASPAPWHVEPMEWDEGRSLGIFDADGDEVRRILPAESCPEDAKWDEVERESVDIPNAHRIAATPELLDMVVRAVEETTRRHGFMKINGKYGDWRDDAEALIAKARGENK